jgi:3-oxoacyl-[acyl-carrier-protein] synthase II
MFHNRIKRESKGCSVFYHISNLSSPRRIKRNSLFFNAIKHVFGKRAYDIVVSSTKSMLGHAMGASGTIEAIACVLAIRTGIVPPTINYENPDPECDLDYVPNQARKLDIRTALSNSFGLGGQNACLVLRKFA